MNKLKTQESYQATAETFALKVADLAPLQSIARFSEMLPKNAVILDVGCGSGRDAKLFIEKGAQVIGIDFSQRMIEIAAQNAPSGQFQVMDIEELEFNACSFDGVWASCSLIHIAKSDLPAVLNKIHAVLKDSGYFYLSLKKGSGEKFEVDTRYGDYEKFVAYYSESEITEILQAAHFKILECTIVDKHHPYLTHHAIRIFCQKA